MNCPRVTIITPVYNSPDVLDTVKSVLSQDYPEIQYIVIDDGSDHFDSDQIEEAAKIVNQKVELIIMKNQFNIGTVRTLNRAIAASDGKYIFSIAADDTLHDTRAISDWVNEFESTGAAVVMGLRDVYDHTMNVRLRVDPSKKQYRQIQSASPQELFEMMNSCNLIIGCCTAQSRETFDKYGLYNETYKYIEDYPRYLFLSRMGVKIHLFNRIVVNYRQGGISSQANFNETYEKENDLIFDKEVLPYTSNRQRCIEDYSRWKKRIVMKASFIQNYQHAEGLLTRGVLVLKYIIHDPLWAGQLIIDTFRVKLRG